MPTYQYACTACAEQLEAVQSFTDPALTECPQCSGALRKVYSAVGVVFKGSGFYKNDSRAAATSDGGAKTDGGKGDGGAKTDSGGKTDGGKDKAPAAKAGAASSGSKSTSTSSTPAAAPA